MDDANGVHSRFWSKVTKGDGCWMWGGARSPKGYGNFALRTDKIVRAHRWSFIEANGPIQSGLDVCHHCDNPSCVRPDHLFAGTRADNMQDAARKGRLNQMPRSGPRVKRPPRTHCFKGHEYTPETTKRNRSTNGRHCRICHLIAAKLRRQKRRQK